MSKHNITQTGKPVRVLLLYFSFSGQSSSLAHHFALGLQKQGVEVVQERIQPLQPLHFPFRSILHTLKMMLCTFLRQRMAIEPLSSACFQPYDLMILAGPTWSYNPSGPVLSLLDRDGARLFADRKVLPLISCRRYWRLHFWTLRRMLRTCGAVVTNRLIVTHPTREPWVTLGVFFKLAGKNPERSKFLGKFYRKYGHSKRQLQNAELLGEKIGEALFRGDSLNDLELPIL